MTIDDQIREGTEAERLLENQLLNDCLDAIREDQFRRFEKAATTNEMESAHALLGSIGLLRSELRKRLANKQKATFNK